MQVQVRECTPVQLNWLVAFSCGATIGSDGEHDGLLHWPNGKWSMAPSDYVSNWAVSGPILDEYPDMQFWKWGGAERPDMQCACMPVAINGVKQMTTYFGASRLEAGLRCVVAARLGEVVELPDELMDESDVVERERER